MKVDRQSMIKKVESNLDQIYASWQETRKNSFKRRGLEKRMSKASKLLNRLIRGDVPSVYEVVGYFGKGSRFI